jgi:hypothetical protein
MNDAFYSRYSYGSADFGCEDDARLLTLGRGLIGTVSQEVIRFQPEQPAIVFGGAGSGKFAQKGAYQLVHPSVQSFFILDVGAQYKNVTWHYNLALGRKAYSLDVKGIGTYGSINHLLDLFGLLKNSKNLFEDCRAVASFALTETDMQGDNSWVGLGARRWMTRFLSSIVRLEGRVTPKRLVQFIHAIDTDDDFLESWGERCRGLSYDEYSIFVEIYRVKHTSEKQYCGIMGKIKDDLDWLSSEQAANSVSGDEDYLSYLGDPNKKVGIYYVIESGSGKVMESLTRMVVGIAMLHCVRAGKGALPLFYLEEAATCGKAEFIRKAVSEHRKHFHTILVYQSPGQLINLFGKAGAQEIMDSCGQQIHLGGGIRSIESAKELADAIGKKTIHVNRHMAQAEHAHRAELAYWDALWNGKDVFEAEHVYRHELEQSRRQEQAGRYVIDPAELMRLKEQVLILSPGMGIRPLLASKLPRYWENPAMVGKYGSDPLFPPVDRVVVPGRWRQKTLPFIRCHVPDYLADWPNHINGEIAYVKGFPTWQ